MTKAGIFVHGRHLETIGWEELVWGVPAADSLGSLPMLVDTLLREPACEPYSTIVMGSGPSTKDGMDEGTYTKHYLLTRLDDLTQFARFKGRLDQAALAMLRERLEAIVVAPAIERTMDEVATVAKMFEQAGVSKVVQITALNHAPRCIKVQTQAREAGRIPKSQQWLVLADERPYADEDAAATLIVEPQHRGDHPLTGHKPALHEAMQPYHYELTPDEQKEFIAIVHAYMDSRSKR